MTSPWGNAPQIPGQPDTTDLIVPTQDIQLTVTFKACGCGVLVGEYCDCAEFAGQLFDLAPIQLPPHCPGLEPLVDPALRGAA